MYIAVKTYYFIILVSKKDNSVQDDTKSTPPGCIETTSGGIFLVEKNLSGLYARLDYFLGISIDKNNFIIMIYT